MSFKSIRARPDYWMAREAAGGHRDANARHTGAPTAFPHSLSLKLTYRRTV